MAWTVAINWVVGLNQLVPTSWLNQCGFPKNCIRSTLQHINLNMVCRRPIKGMHRTSSCQPVANPTGVTIYCWILRRSHRDTQHHIVTHWQLLYLSPHQMCHDICAHACSLISISHSSLQVGVCVIPFWNCTQNIHWSRIVNEVQLRGFPAIPTLNWQHMSRRNSSAFCRPNPFFVVSSCTL